MSLTQSIIIDYTIPCHWHTVIHWIYIFHGHRPGIALRGHMMIHKTTNSLLRSHMITMAHIYNLVLILNMLLVRHAHDRFVGLNESSATVTWPFCELLGLVRHADDRFVDLKGFLGVLPLILSWRPCVVLSHNGPCEILCHLVGKYSPELKVLSNYQCILTILSPVILWFSMSSG